MSTKTQRRFQSYFWMLVNTLVWGATLVIAKPAFAVISPFKLLFYRYFFASLMTLPFIGKLIKQEKKFSTCLKTILPIELFGTVFALSVLYLGLEKTTSLEANLIGSASPVLITLFGIWFLKEKEEKNEWIGLLIAFLATIGLILEPIIKNHNGGHPTIAFYGNLLVFSYMALNTIYVVFAKKYYQKYSKLLVTFISFYLGLFAFFLLSLYEFSTHHGLSLINFFQSSLQELSHPLILAICLFMSLFASVIGLFSYLKGQEGIEASEASLFMYLQPLVYIPLGIILLKETVNAMQIILLLIILGSVIFAESRVKASKKRH